MGADFIAQVHRADIDRQVMARLRADQRFEGVRLLPDGTALVQVRLPSSTEAAPRFLTGRVVGYQHTGGQPSRLFVTMQDHEKFPGRELVKLYHERWELEVGYDELKTDMLERRESLRSLSPRGVEQELWGLLITGNLVRREMLLAAKDHGTTATRISFRTSLLYVRDFFIVTAWGSPGNIPGHFKDFRLSLRGLLLPPRRSARRYPRHVKIKMSNYPRNRGKRP